MQFGFDVVNVASCAGRRFYAYCDAEIEKKANNQTADEQCLGDVRAPLLLLVCVSVIARSPH